METIIRGIKKNFIYSSTFNTLTECTSIDKLSLNKQQNFENFFHPETNYIKDYIERKVQNLTLQITQKCNLRCSYCPYTVQDNDLRSHSNKSMNQEDIVKAIDFLYVSSIDRENVTINFYGGEPLIEFELIKFAVEYAKSVFSNKMVSFNMTTNGTMFNDEILRFLSYNDFKIMISLDGPKHINDKNRVYLKSDKSVFDTVISWIERIYIDYNDFYNKIGINMVIDPEVSFIEYKKLFDDYSVLENIFLTISSLDEDNNSSKRAVLKENNLLKKIEAFKSYLFFIGRISKLSKFNQSAFGNYVRNSSEELQRMKPMEKEFAPSGPCIPGKKKIYINVDGNILPCEKINEKNEFNIIGNLNSGINYINAIEIMNVSKINAENCKRCFAVRLCKNCVKEYDGKSNINANCEKMRKTVYGDLTRKVKMKEIKEII